MASSNMREAQQHLREAIQVAMRGGFHANVLDALVSMATVCVQVGDTTSALELATLVLQDPATKHPSWTRAEQLRAEFAGRMTLQQIEEAQAQARSFDAVVNQTNLGCTCP